MAYGIQVNTAAGVTQFDSNNRLTRFIGTFSYPSFTFPATATITIPSIIADGTWACFSDNVNVGVTINTGSLTVSNSAGTAVAGVVTVFRY